MGIPISSSERIKWIDNDPCAREHEAIYFFSYLTGDKQDAFLALQKEMMVTIKKCMPEARRLIDSDSQYKSASAKQKTKLIAEKASELAQELAENREKNSLDYSKKIIDMFLVGWDGKDFPDFPKDGRPSRMLKLPEVNRISGAISDMMGELCGLSIADSKN